MSEITLEQIKAHVADLKKIFEDGFQLEDVPAVVKEAMEIAQTYKSTAGLTGPARKELAIKLINQVVDETDTPWLPDPLTDPLIKRFVPNLIDVIHDASEGKFSFGSKTEEFVEKLAEDEEAQG